MLCFFQGDYAIPYLDQDRNDPGAGLIVQGFDEPPGPAAIPVGLISIGRSPEGISTRHRFIIYLFAAVARHSGMAVADGSYLIVNRRQPGPFVPLAVCWIANYLVVRGSYGVWNMTIFTGYKGRLRIRLFPLGARCQVKTTVRISTWAFEGWLWRKRLWSNTDIISPSTIKAICRSRIVFSNSCHRTRRAYIPLI